MSMNKIRLQRPKSETTGQMIRWRLRKQFPDVDKFSVQRKHNQHFGSHFAVVWDGPESDVARIREWANQNLGDFFNWGKGV